MKFWQSKYNPQITLSQQELLEISQKISREFSPVADSAFPELVLLPVDPFHLYAYWNLGENFINNSKTNDNRNLQLTLRIYSRPHESPGFYNTKQWFDVSVNRIQHQQKIRLPLDQTFYSAVIGKHFPDNSFAAHAYSNIIHVPRSGMASATRKNSEANELFDRSKQFDTNEKNSLTERGGEDNITVINDFIMKDNLYAESKIALARHKNKPEMTSHSASSNNASGLGIKAS